MLSLSDESRAGIPAAKALPDLKNKPTVQVNVKCSALSTELHVQIAYLNGNEHTVHILKEHSGRSRCHSWCREYIGWDATLQQYVLVTEFHFDEPKEGRQRKNAKVQQTKSKGIFFILSE